MGVDGGPFPTPKLIENMRIFLAFLAGGGSQGPLSSRGIIGNIMISMVFGRGGS